MSSIKLTLPLNSWGIYRKFGRSDQVAINWYPVKLYNHFMTMFVETEFTIGEGYTLEPYRVQEYNTDYTLDEPDLLTRLLQDENYKPEYLLLDQAGELEAQLAEPVHPKPLPPAEPKSALPSPAESGLLMCYKLNRVVLEHSKLVVDEYLKLSEAFQSQLKNTLKMNLTDAGLAKLNNPTAGETLRFASADFHKLKKRKDESLKKVMSIVLKVIYRQYLHAHKINQSFNPRTYVKREEINRQIFVKYFGRDPWAFDDAGNKVYQVRNPAEVAARKSPSKAKAQKAKQVGKVHLEHMRIFLIKNGVTREWFEYATGQKGGEIRWKFFQTIQKILCEERFLRSYRKKIQSMLSRYWKVSGSNQANSEQESVATEASTMDFTEASEERTLFFTNTEIDSLFNHQLPQQEQEDREFNEGFNEEFWNNDPCEDEDDAHSTAGRDAGEQEEDAQLDGPRRTAKHPNSILQIKEAVKIAMECLTRFHMNPKATN